MSEQNKKNNDFVSVEWGQHIEKQVDHINEEMGGFRNQMVSVQTEMSQLSQRQDDSIELIKDVKHEIRNVSEKHYKSNTNKEFPLMAVIGAISIVIMFVTFVLNPIKEDQKQERADRIDADKRQELLLKEMTKTIVDLIDKVDERQNAALNKHAQIDGHAPTVKQLASTNSTLNSHIPMDQQRHEGLVDVNIRQDGTLEFLSQNIVTKAEHMERDRIKREERQENERRIEENRQRIANLESRLSFGDGVRHQRENNTP